MHSILLLFVDGLGLGENNPAINPCANRNWRYLSCFRDEANPVSRNGDGFLVQTDANLGTGGLPQSATGQVTLLTGINSAAKLGRHKPGYPNQILRDLLRQHSLLKTITNSGYPARFINVFRPLFFTLNEKTKWRLSATTVANLAAGLPFFTLVDLKNRQAIYHDFTNHHLKDRGFNVPIFTEKDAAGILADAAGQYRFTLYEYFMTDRAGHKQNMEKAVEEISKLDRLLTHLLEQIDLKRTTLILTSDHGNIEDLSVKTHTRNPAMTLIWGVGAEKMANRIQSLEDITPAILNLLNS